MENVKEIGRVVPLEDPGTDNRAAFDRHLAGMGRDLDALRLSMDNLKDKGQYVYKLEFRAPSKKSAEWLLLAKMVEVDGPKISFTSAHSLTNALFTFGRRLRAGGVDWHEDGFPPDDWPERLAYLVKNATWLNF